MCNTVCKGSAEDDGLSISPKPAAQFYAFGQRRAWPMHVHSMVWFHVCPGTTSIYRLDTATRSDGCDVTAMQSEHPFANVWEGAALSPWNSVRSQHGDDVMAAVPEEHLHDSLASMPSSSGDPKPYKALDGPASLPAT